MTVPIQCRDDETFVLNLGPQHPATHGVLRVKLTMDGEYIVKAEPVLDYIHRMHEKMAEDFNFAQFMPNTARMDYLHALAYVNDISLHAWDYVRLNQRAENEYIGLNNGILDQTSIVFGQAKAMVHIDTIAPKANIMPDPLDEHGYRILVAYSGYSRELTSTGYNSRVSECREAARMLGQKADIPGA